MNAFMRTTLTLDDDVAARLIELQRRKRLAFKDAVNEVLRRGLEVELSQTAVIKPFKVIARPMGIKPGLNYANIGELLEQMEGIQS